MKTEISDCACLSFEFHVVCAAALACATYVSRSSTNNIPPGSHGEKVADLVSPSRVIRRADENGSLGLDG